MKTFESKYDIEQEVYVLTNKKIYKTSIENIKITHVKPHKLLKFVNKEAVLTDTDGITIEYLVEIYREQQPGCKGVSINYDWYKEEDVFLDKEELIRKIK